MIVYTTVHIVYNIGVPCTLDLYVLCVCVCDTLHTCLELTEAGSVIVGLLRPINPNFCLQSGRLAILRTFPLSTLGEQLLYHQVPHNGVAWGSEYLGSVILAI